MNPAAPTAIWVPLLALLTVEVALAVLLVELLRRGSRSPGWGRLYCRLGLVAVLALTAGELSGVARQAAGWIVGLGPREAGAPLVRKQRPGPAYRPQLSPAVAGGPGVANVRSEPAGQKVAPSFAAASAASGGASPDAPTAPRCGAAARPEAAGEGSGLMWLGLVWIVGSLVVGGRAGLGRCLLIRFRWRHRAQADPSVLPRVHELAAALHLRGRVRVFVSKRLASPMAFGWIWPAIALPADLASQLDPVKLEAVLAHELAHLAARDPLWCLVAEAATAVLWWHPAVWWLRRQSQLASELAADEASLLVTGGPRALAECLVELGARLLAPRSAGQLQAAGFRSQLGCRVQRLLSLESRPWSPPGRAAVASAAVLGPVALVAIVILCSAWITPKTLTKGDSMKLVQKSWRQSLAAFSLLATVNTPALPQDPRDSAATPAAAPLPVATSNLPSIHGAGGAVPAEQVMAYQALTLKLDALLSQDRDPSLAHTEYEPVVQQVHDLQIARLMREKAYLERDFPGLAHAAAWGSAAPTAATAARSTSVTRTGAAPPETAGGRVRNPTSKRDPIEAKLEQVSLDTVTSDGLPLSEMLRFLDQQSRQRDPERTGVNFLIDRSPPPAPANPALALDPATGLPLAAPVVEAVDLGNVSIHFNLPLHHVTLKEVLDAMLKAADRPITYQVEDYGVVFSLKSEKPEGPATESAPERLSVRTFEVDAPLLRAGLDSTFGISRDLETKLALRKLLAKLGIPLEGRKTLYFNPQTRVAMLRATPDDLELFTAALHTATGIDYGLAPGRRMPMNGPPSAGGGGGMMGGIPSGGGGGLGAGGGAGGGIGGGGGALGGGGGGSEPPQSQSAPKPTRPPQNRF